MARLPTPPKRLLSIALLTRVCGGLLLCGTLTVGFLSYASLDQVRVGSVHYDDIIDAKDYIADFLPPPLYPVEAYALAGMTLNNPEKASENAEKIAVLRTSFDQRIVFWKERFGSRPPVSPEAWKAMDEGFTTLGRQFWDEMNGSFLPAAAAGDPLAMAASMRRLTPHYEAYSSLAYQAAEQMAGYAQVLQGDAARKAETAQWVNGALNGAMIVLVAVFLVLAQRHVVRALVSMSRAMDRLAAGDLDAEIPFGNRQDEVGRLALAMAVFKRNAIEGIASRKAADAEARRRESEESAWRRDAEATAEQQSQFVRVLGDGLARLAERNLAFRITADVPGRYEVLKAAFNRAMDQFEAVIRQVSLSSDTISASTQEISSASADLSRRTEQQAENLARTATAMSEIAGRVRRAATDANEARNVVSLAREDAVQSGDIVRQAIESMNGIERSSREVTQIVNVIEELSFQTNLLALNAGVEAARAGSAGRGFAVVAEEVRALAQRSTTAAKEISRLIGQAQSEVGQGVRLVGETGGSLSRIATRVVELSGVVESIAGAADEQASKIAEVNGAVNMMDKSTQQNAAMVEQASAQTRAVAQQSETLNTMIASFTLSSQSAARPAPAGIRLVG